MNLSSDINFLFVLNNDKAEQYETLNSSADRHKTTKKLFTS